MKWMFFVCVLLLALTGCNAAKQVSQQSQYVPVPALTGKWNVVITIQAPATATLQANLVSVPCSTIDALVTSPVGGGATLSSWASSCSLADNFNGTGSVADIPGGGDYFDYTPQVVVVATGTSGSSTNPTTTMNLYMLECSGTSTACYANQPDEIFFGQGTLATPSTSLSGIWECQGDTSSPCYGYAKGTFVGTQQ